MRGEQREGVGADRVEGDITEIEKPGEPDHDVEAEAEHHISEDQDRQVEEITQRQSEMERLLDDISEDREERRGDDEKQRAIVRAIPAHRGDGPDRAPCRPLHRPTAVPPEKIEEEPADKDDADGGGEQHGPRLER